MVNTNRARQVKSCDFNWRIAVKVFEMLNPKDVRLDGRGSPGFTPWDICIVTDAEPKDLIYPEGWYYANGHFRNKHQSSDGVYSEIQMIHSSGRPHIENYSTL